MRVLTTHPPVWRHDSWKGRLSARRPAWWQSLDVLQRSKEDVKDTKRGNDQSPNARLLIYPPAWQEDLTFDGLFKCEQAESRGGHGSVILI